MSPSFILFLGFSRGRSSFDFPAEGAGAENGGIAFLQLREQELRLAFVNLQHVFVHRALDRIHDQVAGFRQTTEEDDGFRT